ncbi:hypothetical protein Ahy_A09g043015 isoform A [Arachis hypogaea]|uniref:At2g35280-like TPR domain-containing protein n=1 Tax=Arachis hypogaea TaxID=3818 RepID=A0A445BHB2_ARAHY|nr:hypothetical protein Ahy_A09g043015 isoform A [Arachis hypogaea]
MTVYHSRQSSPDCTVERFVQQRVERRSNDKEEPKKVYNIICKFFWPILTMRVIPLVSFLFYLDRPERSFIDRCVEAGNADPILRQRLTEYFWIARHGIGMELLSRAWTEGSIEAGYLSAMLLLCDHALLHSFIRK